MGDATNRKWGFLTLSFVVLAVMVLAGSGQAYRRMRGQYYRERSFHGLRTDTTKRIIKLSELKPTSSGKYGIPALRVPVFSVPAIAETWLGSNEPVISVVIGNQSRAYPLQILLWHEIVNDTIDRVQVAVTFCPLCYSANVFDRRVEGRGYSFGVSGLLRHSGLVMYDRRTESLWQQITGEAIVGKMVGSQLKRLPAQIISFEQFRSAHKDGLVLSRKTGYRRPYGENPYPGYDDISNSPSRYHGEGDERLRPMEKVVGVTIADLDKAYPYSVTRKLRVINDTIANVPFVVFHAEGARSAFDEVSTDSSREVGSTGVFERRFAGRLLEFRYRDGEFHDEQTESTWDITGRATRGLLKGKQLPPIVHGDYFAFAWLVFKPQTRIHR